MLVMKWKKGISLGLWKLSACPYLQTVRRKNLTDRMVEYETY